MTGRRALAVVAVVGAAIAGGIVAVAVRGGAPQSAASAPPPATTTTVVRTNLATTVLTEGTLGYAPSPPIVNRLDGTYTDLPQVGTTIGFGQGLYRVDNEPVVLMGGSTPAWRPFAPGMTDGPDVTELQSDLIALGDASGLLSYPSGRYDTATIDAVERWQRAHELAPNAEIALGEIAFLPEPVLVGAPNTAAGDPASPGDDPYTVTTTRRTVTVPLNANLPPINPGETVSILLPTNVTTPGTITQIGPDPSPPSSETSSGAGSRSSVTSTIATVSPVDPTATGNGAAVPVQVSLTTQSVNHVLAVSISALLAVAGGGYGVEVVAASGAHRLVGVTTGLFTGSQVQITGPGIAAGTRVVVAQ